MPPPTQGIASLHVKAFPCFHPSKNFHMFPLTKRSHMLLLSMRRTPTPSLRVFLFAKHLILKKEGSHTTSLLTSHPVLSPYTVSLT